MNLELLLENLRFLETAFLLAFFIAFFWLAFYYHSSKKLTTPQTFLLKIFFLGMGIAIVAAFLERGVLTNFFPKGISFIFSQGKAIRTPDEFLSILIFSSLFIAFPEEFLKFIFFRKLILPPAQSTEYSFNTPALPTIKGDINQDGRVNSLDYSLLVAKWFKTTDITQEDLNKDGIVNVRDLGILMSNWKE